jgi:hypothetical protein
MANTFTAVTKQDNDWWIGWIEEVPGVNCQERTHEKLLESLRTTLIEAARANEFAPTLIRQPCRGEFIRPASF